MSKAERRKRSRERQRQREAERKQQEAKQAGGEQAGAAPVAEVTAAADVAASAPPPPATAAAPAPVEPESPFITGPVTPRSPAARAGVRMESSELLDAPLEEEDDLGEEDDDDLGEEDDGEEDDGEEDDGEEDDGEEDDEEDDEDLDLEDCLLEVACGAVEQGPKLEWSELCAWLAAVEITDPRLALLIGLLCENDTTLTGERVLATLEEMELGDLARDAREIVAQEAEDGVDTDPEERAVVRTTSRELKAQAEQHLGGRRDERKPVKSTQLRQGGVARNVLAAVTAGGASSAGERKS